MADSLRRYNMESIFICRRLPGHLGEYIRDKGYSVEWIESKNGEFRSEVDAAATKTILAKSIESPDWLIIDHYGIDKEWEAAVGPYAKHMLVIDDLANRPHDCDILLDQNAYEQMETRYNKLVPPHCLQLLGPRFLLLRPSFYEARRTLRARIGMLERMLVFFGGSDPTNETAKALQALKHLPSDDLSFHTDVVIGSSNPFHHEIAAMCEPLPHVTLHVQAENMAELIANADFALGAGGVGMWERCYLGLPSAVTVVADNQAESVRYAARMGAIEYLGESGDTNEATYSEAIKRAMKSPQALLKMTRKAFELTASDAERTESPVLAAMLALDNK
ncbi:UDP-2,4-diacetamido-2,4,6-trideoxy-beta-L-altropyranose hydrolase [Cohnella thailandensis]|nr:UDP-2,4-diacetamido-2,4,6-trideoxy-beta-L-altropyranose hydrolase [Cohnella thailandensis]